MHDELSSCLLRWLLSQPCPTVSLWVEGWVRSLKTEREVEGVAAVLLCQSPCPFPPPTPCQTRGPITVAPSPGQKDLSRGSTCLKLGTCSEAFPGNTVPRTEGKHVSFVSIWRLRGCPVRSVHGQSSSFMGTTASEKGANFRERDRGRRGVKDRGGEKERRRGRRG